MPGVRVGVRKLIESLFVGGAGILPRGDDGLCVAGHRPGIQALLMDKAQRSVHLGTLPSGKTLHAWAPADDTRGVWPKALMYICTHWMLLVRCGEPARSQSSMVSWAVRRASS